MKYFKYSGGRNSSQFQLARIFNAVQKMKQIAIARYGVRYQDALDAAFFHIVDNYDESFDEDEDNLERYTSSIVSTIYRNNFRHEVLSDSVLDITSNNNAVKEVEEEDPWEDVGVDLSAEFEKDVEECTSSLLPNFLKDFEIFKTKSPSNRKMSYSSIYSKYSDSVISETVNRLGKYYEDAKYLYELGKTCHLRSFTSDRYKSFMDESIRLSSIVNGIAVCSFSSSHIKRNVYKVHVSEFIDEVVENFYSKVNPIGYRNICGHSIYCTLSGKEVEGESALRKSLETEIVGTLFAKVINLRVVDYKEGAHLFVSSSKPEEYGLVFSMFGVDTVLQMSIMPVRRVVLSQC